MLTITGLVHRHPGAAPINFPDFTAAQGARVRVVGPSGSGKSTLLALLAGVLKVQQGRVQVGAGELPAMSERQRDAWRGATLGFVPQRLHLSGGLTVAQNLALPYVAAGLAVDQARIAGVLQRLGLGSFAQALPANLSVGQAQRVAMARALLRRPAVILADEPTAHLDDTATAAALALLAEVAAEQHATLVLATHDRRVHEAWPGAAELRLGGELS